MAACPANGFVPNGTVCRVSGAPCDAPESCTGVSAPCPSDVSYPNGTPMPACVGPPNATGFDCQGGACHITVCASTWYDINSTYSDGCDCQDTGSPNVCGSAQNFGSISPGGSNSGGGTIVPGQSDYYTVTFPGSARPMAGIPTITLSGSGMLMDVTTDCSGSGTVCSDAASSFGLTQWQQLDNQSVVGTGYWSNGIPEYNTLWIRVYRSSPATTCAAAAYSISVGR
jgi:hypothetical protein